MTSAGIMLGSYEAGYHSKGSGDAGGNRGRGRRRQARDTGRAHDRRSYRYRACKARRTIATLWTTIPGKLRAATPLAQNLRTDPHALRRS